MNSSHDTARTLYLELAAHGADLTTGEVAEPAIKTLADIGRAERLLVRVRLHRDALRELLIEQDDADMLAVREEGYAG
jgi:hypothetical protein